MAEILSKIEEEAKRALDLLWKKIDPKDLEPGDHIYSHRRYGSYSHHGIYVGEGFVIHFTRTEIKNENAIIPLPKSQQSSERPRPPCPNCGYDEQTDHGVVKTCLDCFRRGKEKLHSIRYYIYGAPRLGHRLKKSGTCTMRVSNRTPDEVVRAAYELLRSNQGFGEYNLKRNNCEHFATYCSTGQRQCEQLSFYNRVEERVKKMIG